MKKGSIESYGNALDIITLWESKINKNITTSTIDWTENSSYEMDNGYIGQQYWESEE